MSIKTLISGLGKYHKALNGSTVEFDLTEYRKVFNEIDKLKTIFENKTDDELREISRGLIRLSRNGADPDDLLAEAYALVRETIKRVLGLNAFDVQILGALALHAGKLAEMQTGEGKTLTAVFPAYLNALSGRGVHILTFNDYLAKRDAKWMGPVYNFLGLSVGSIQQTMTIEERQKSYNCDITYLTAKESGFDFLRDSLSYSKQSIVHRSFNFAIIDEADSILIDEARVPLIIAGSTAEASMDKYFLSKAAEEMIEGIDFLKDRYARNIHLTDNGLKKAETMLRCGNLYDEKNIELLTGFNCAMHAEYLLKKDVDYIVREGKVELVDEFTGRIADQRRWPDGLQQAVEAKEELGIKQKGNILNTITLQHFIRLYPRISGMTATAQLAEMEFAEFYNLHIVVIPPNSPCIREDHPDVIFKTKKAKYEAVVKEILKVNETGRPVLAGTSSIEESALLAAMLQKKGIKCEILNAKRDEFEAGIIALAGKKKAVTISTNMAGRGTDILLGAGEAEEKETVKSLGGLYVIGTNRHESRRIDNQLRGRSGRQGDPGSSRFLISMEDDLFIKYRLKNLLPKNYSFDHDNILIANRSVKFEIDRVQRIISGQNLEIKKTLFKYSFILEEQRKILSQRRIDFLDQDKTEEFFKSSCPENFEALIKKSGRERILKVCSHLSLYHIDRAWSAYLSEISDIRESIHFRRLGGQDPLFEFHKAAVEIFDKLLLSVDNDIADTFNKIDSNDVDKIYKELKAPSSTWTYIVNDEFYDDLLGIQLIGSMNIGNSLAAVMMWPLTVMIPLFRKIHRRAKINRGQ